MVDENKYERVYEKGKVKVCIVKHNLTSDKKAANLKELEDYVSWKIGHKVIIRDKNQNNFSNL